MRVRQWALILLGSLVLEIPAAAQLLRPLCNGTCSPDPTSPTYSSGTVKARPLPKNQRGRSSPLGAPAGLWRGPVDGDTPSPSLPLPGSTSFTYAIPILNLPGRNGLDVSLTLYYNSAIWTIDPVNATATLNADRDFPGYGFRLGYGMMEGSFGNELGSTSYLLTEPDGSKRELRFLSGSTFESFDNTFLDFNSSTLTLYRKDGTQWKYQAVTGTTFFVPFQIQDTNGNYITITYNTAAGFNAQAISAITDSVGRTVTFNYDPTTHLLSSITAPALGGVGTTTVATFAWAQKTLVYNFTLSVTDTVASGDATHPLNILTQCRYANQAGYNFSYGDWGIVNEIDQVSVTGALRAYERYNFPTATTALSDAPTYTMKTVFDGVNTATWTYQVAKSGFLVSSFATTDPAGTTTTTNLFTSGWQTGLVSSVVMQSGASTLRSVTNNWTQDNTIVSYKTNPRVFSVVSTLGDTGQQSQVLVAYTSYGNVSQVQEYDYGPVLARTTQTDYLSAAAYVSQHILNRPAQVRVYDASGNLKSRTDLAYDGSVPTSVAGASQHDDTNYGSGFNTRGNLTLTTRYPSLPSTTPVIARSFTYDILGNLLTAQVDCCQLEQWTYTIGTQFAYPETIKRGPSLGPQLTTTQSYDFNTGLLISRTDPNQKPTSFSYDVMKRPTSVTAPLGANTNLSYDDVSAQPGGTASTALDATNRLVQVVTTDGLGRTTRQETRSAAATTYSIVETQHDALGQVTAASNPHGPSETPVWTTTSYDALGRVTTSTPPGAAGSYQASYSGNAVTVTDPSGKQRRSVSDALGRVVQVHEPGYSDGSPGTGSVTISGVERSVQIPSPDPNCTVRSCFQTVYDSGSVWITVGSYTATAYYGQFSTSASIAAALANTLNTDPSSPVTATASSGTVSLVAKQSGVHTNYSLSVGSSTDDVPDFGSPSFTASPSGATLTGGVDGTGANGLPPSLNTPLVTLYSYGPLDNLTLVQQGVQQRRFIYDGLGRLTTQTTPEGGTVNFTYTDFSAVATRSDARSVITSYGYDGLNRLTQVSYNVGASGVPATPGVTFSYDAGGAAANALGRLTSMTDGVGGESYQYDALGRVTALTKTISGASYPLSYQYNLASALASITYPSGRVVQQSFDPIGRLSQITSAGTNYLSNLAYNAAFQPTAMTYGNGVQGSLGYNARLQLATLAYASGATTLFSLAYNYGTSNNGQIQSITDNVDVGRTANYTYDAWARLKTAGTTGSTAYPAWGLSWTYDRYGNRKAQTVTAGTGPLNSVTVDPSTNRITDPGYSYDAAGNLTADGLNTLTYDGENRVASNAQAGLTTSYTYDGNGLRVQKTSGSTATVYIFSGTKVIAEYVNGAAVASPTREYIYSGSAPLAKVESGAPQYYHADHLSARVITDGNGIVSGQQGHYPFGEAWYEGATPNKLKFTSYERDAESGNDYALARYHINRLGRFSSPDPVAGSLADPQSLNRYAYVLNSPTNLTDPFGLVCQEDGRGCGSPSQGLSGGTSFIPLLPDYGWVGDEWVFMGYLGYPAWWSYGGGGGRDVNLTFAATFKCNLNSTQAIKALQSNFASFAGYSSSQGYIVFPPGPLAPGQRIRIDTTLNVPPRALASREVQVDVRSNSQTSFTFEAVQGQHFFYPGTIAFSSTDVSNGQINFSVNVSATFANLWTRLGFYLGGQQFEKDVWNHLIQGIRALCAGTGK